MFENFSPTDWLALQSWFHFAIDVLVGVPLGIYLALRRGPQKARELVHQDMDVLLWGAKGRPPSVPQEGALGHLRGEITVEVAQVERNISSEVALLQEAMARQQEEMKAFLEGLQEKMVAQIRQDFTVLKTEADQAIAQAQAELQRQAAELEERHKGATSAAARQMSALGVEARDEQTIASELLEAQLTAQVGPGPTAILKGVAGKSWKRASRMGPEGAKWLIEQGQSRGLLPRGNGQIGTYGDGWNTR